MEIGDDRRRDKPEDERRCAAAEATNSSWAQERVVPLIPIRSRDHIQVQTMVVHSTVTEQAPQAE
jgi:hypothetical protein